MGGDIDLFTAVPAGYGDGAGLPVVVVMHGASASASDFRGFGSRPVPDRCGGGGGAAVRAGRDRRRSVRVGPRAGGVDPARMLQEELPGWLPIAASTPTAERCGAGPAEGTAPCGCALGGPDWAAAWALFSPAVLADDPALADLSALPTADRLLVRHRRRLLRRRPRRRRRLPDEPEIDVYDEGGHTRVFWNDHTLDAFAPDGSGGGAGRRDRPRPAGRVEPSPTSFNPVP